jgi:hypothetical protein
VKLYIDTEFNSFGGELISMALAAEDGSSWYAAITPSAPLHPWVEEHVMPVLHIEQGTRAELQASLAAYLARFDTVHIVADWPEDIAHFCGILITGPGTRIDTPHTTMEIDRGLDSGKSLCPHNALLDAVAIRHMATAK